MTKLLYIKNEQNCDCLCLYMSYCVTDLDMEEELADYNGDDENEGEFEADKQAELAQK